MKIKAMLISQETPNVDINEVKKNNINLIFIRIGYTSYGKSKERMKDSKFNVNYKKLVKHKIPIGIYYESCAVNKKEAKEEATYFLKLLEEKNLSYPIAVLICDMHSTIIYSDKNQLNLTKKEMIDVVLSFCNRIKQDGKSVFITSYKNWFDNNLNDEEIFKYEILIVPNEFNKLENRMYNMYKDNIVYLCSSEECNKLEIKLEKNSVLDKIKALVKIPLKYIKNKLN